MASGVSNGEGDDEVKDKKFDRVYRRIRSLKKDENRTKDENGSTEDSSQILVSQEDLNLVAQDTNAQEALARVDRDSAVVVKKLTETRHETLTQGPNPELVDKKLVEAPPSQEDVTHSQASVEKDADTKVVDKNSIDLSSESPVEEHFDTVVVDKNAIKKSIEASLTEDTNVVVLDSNPIPAAQPLVSASSDLILTTKHQRFSVQGAVNSDGMMRNDTLDDQIRLNLVSSSKQQKREVRKKLQGQLDMIQDSLWKIEAIEGEINRYSNPNMFVSGRTSTGTSHEVFRPSHQPSVSAFENQGMSDHVEREKRIRKANPLYNSEFLLAKDKRPLVESKKKSRSNAKKQGEGELGHGVGPRSKVYKNCSTLLQRLIKHQHGWVFNAPVDVKGLGLHDYYTIIKRPMDLGTVKCRLTKNQYKSPREFAEDVRLTFHNAMTYNPKGHDVHIMAEKLLKIFEDRWVCIEADYNREMSFTSEDEVNFLNHHSLERPSLKKPKADQPDKRDMTKEEKEKLNLDLLDLPQEKHDQLLQIVEKWNPAISQQHDQIVIDVDRLDPETLWEFDRLVTNYKKSLSKKKTTAEPAMQAIAEAEKDIQEKNSTTIIEKFPRREIAEKNLSVSLLSQVQKQADNASKLSSSSTSSSDSSSSSTDSDSDSSSSSESD